MLSVMSVIGVIELINRFSSNGCTLYRVELILKGNIEKEIEFGYLIIALSECSTVYLVSDIQ